MTINFVWEGRYYPVEVKSSNTSAYGEYLYLDFVSLLDGISKEGREDLFSTAIINHGEEVRDIQKEIAIEVEVMVSPGWVQLQGHALDDMKKGDPVFLEPSTGNVSNRLPGGAR